MSTRSVWTFKIVCEFGLYLEDEWEREFEICSDFTLLDLHVSILEIIGFDNDHLYDFFAGRRSSNRKHIFTEDESWEKREYVFSTTTLESIYPLPKDLKLYYIFDYGDKWTFRIVKTRKKPKGIEKDVEYPKVIKELGKNPDQYPIYDD